jgi:hypothetical protein
MARVARTAATELICNPTTDPGFRKYLDGGEVALDDMLVVPILASAGGNLNGDRNPSKMVPQPESSGDVHEQDPKEQAPDAGGQEEPHPNVIAVMQVRPQEDCGIPQTYADWPEVRKRHWVGCAFLDLPSCVWSDKNKVAKMGQVFSKQATQALA